jgi:hypothetical protein
MFFLFRVAFWTAVVAVFVPGASSGIGLAAGPQTLERFKTGVIQRLARVRADLNAGNMRAP